MMDIMHSGFVTGEGVHNLSASETSDWCTKGALILDVREEYVNQFKKFDVPATIQIPFGRLISEIARLPRDRWIIVADTAGLHSKEACLLLQEKGFTQISNLAGGLVEWERDGLPLVVDKSERLSGSCACQLRPREKK